MVLLVELAGVGAEIATLAGAAITEHLVKK